MHYYSSVSLLGAVAAAANLVAAQSPTAAAAAAATPVATRTTNIAPANATPQVAAPFPSVANVKQVAAAAQYPNLPTLWPDADESKGPIALDSLLSAPLVTAGLAKVTAMVDAKLLALKPSIRNGYQSETLYQEDPVANCFWPTNQCHTPATTTLKYLQPDVVSCIDANTMGLNYDDGNGPTGQPTQGNETTLALGQKLQGMNLTATFFVTGGSSFYNPDALQALYAQGHELAVHTWTHAPLTSLTNQQIVAEILYTEAFIYALVGQRPRYFRPPYGDVDNRVRAIIGALGYESVMWQESKDLQDQTATAASSPASSFVAKFDSWMTPQPGYIDLEHSLLAPVNVFASAILDDVAARKAAGQFVPNIVPVGTCQKKSSYVPLGFALGDAAGATANSTTPSSSAAAGAPTRSSAVSAGATPKSTASSMPGASGANSGAAPPAASAFLAGSVAAVAAAAAAVLAF